MFKDQRHPPPPPSSSLSIRMSEIKLRCSKSTTIKHGFHVWFKGKYTVVDFFMRYKDKKEGLVKLENDLEQD
ncbi:hypothetical protein L2E82_34155 [Cichorium intybus]|uniref:Uncharacterized protein n=1 Tax=Cichorium intybus TaxID=13427 RepID=A0ACB9BM05_CICIN|nr:hypothetical protein L2E82_34155 [Cichorium intybus]